MDIYDLILDKGYIGALKYASTVNYKQADTIDRTVLKLYRQASGESFRKTAQQYNYIDPTSNFTPAPQSSQVAPTAAPSAPTSNLPNSTPQLPQGAIPTPGVPSAGNILGGGARGAYEWQVASIALKRRYLLKLPAFKQLIANPNGPNMEQAAKIIANAPADITGPMFSDSVKIRGNFLDAAKSLSASQPELYQKLIHDAAAQITDAATIAKVPKIKGWVQKFTGSAGTPVPNTGFHPSVNGFSPDNLDPLAQNRLQMNLKGLNPEEILNTLAKKDLVNNSKQPTETIQAALKTALQNNTIKSFTADATKQLVDADFVKYQSAIAQEAANNSTSVYAQAMAPDADLATKQKALKALSSKLGVQLQSTNADSIRTEAERLQQVATQSTEQSAIDSLAKQDLEKYRGLIQPEEFSALEQSSAADIQKALGSLSQSRGMAPLLSKDPAAISAATEALKGADPVAGLLSTQFAEHLGTTGLADAGKVVATAPSASEGTAAKMLASLATKYPAAAGAIEVLGKFLGPIAVAFQGKGVFDDYEKYGWDSRTICDAISLLLGVASLFAPEIAGPLWLISSVGCMFAHHGEPVQQQGQNPESITEEAITAREANINWTDLSSKDQSTASNLYTQNSSDENKLKQAFFGAMKSNQFDKPLDVMAALKKQINGGGIFPGAQPAVQGGSSGAQPAQIGSEPFIQNS